LAIGRIVVGFGQSLDDLVRGVALAQQIEAIGAVSNVREALCRDRARVGAREGTTEPTLTNFDWTATPTASWSGSRATIENVLGRGVGIPPRGRPPAKALIRLWSFGPAAVAEAVGARERAAPSARDSCEG